MHKFIPFISMQRVINDTFLSGIGFCSLIKEVFLHHMEAQAVILSLVGWCFISTWIKNRMEVSFTTDQVIDMNTVKPFKISRAANIKYFKYHIWQAPIFVLNFLFLYGLGFATVLYSLVGITNANVLRLALVLWIVLSIWGKIQYDYWLYTKRVAQNK